MLDYEEEVNQEILNLNGKFKKEKDEYIDKIIKLNNKIEELEAKINDLEKIKHKENSSTVFDQVNI
jgi:hypothetical protein